MIPAARPIPILSRTTDLQIAGGLTLLSGWAFWEPTGLAAATLRLFDGTNDDGTLIVPISLDAGQSTRDMIPEPFLAAYAGLYLEVVSGTVEGAVWSLQAELHAGIAFAEGVAPVWSGDE